MAISKIMRNTKLGFKTFLLMLADFLIINLSPFIAALLVLDMNAESIQGYAKTFIVGLPVLTIVYLFVFYLFGIYKVLWKYASVTDVFSISVATAVSCLAYFLIQNATNLKFHNTTYVIIGIIMLGGLLGLRVLIRFFGASQKKKHKAESEAKNVMVIGGGNAGMMLLRDIKTNPSFSNYNVKCVIDDNEYKTGKKVYGVDIIGGRECIDDAVKKYGISLIIYAIPSSRASDRAAILQTCSATGCEVKLLPDIAQLSDENVKASALRNISIEDLLGRDAIKIELDSIMRYVEGQTVLVTGGGGSIGSELCRQLAAHSPKQLIIFDIYENNAYDIQNELLRKYPELDIKVLIGSVRDADRMESLFARYRPDIVYHAAAHKHVPLMEDSPNEAIKNNVFGTLNTVRAADHYGVKRFVLISTDKAVNPTNIMGASKRICEMIVQSYNTHSETEYVAVRFGNVLGSNGSVIPLFRRQIRAGGPVTVTHPDIIRYFMTIPEAVSLVLQAGAQAKGGEIFVLDMGKPMKILDMAEKMIRLCGLEPYKDIEIQFTGLRPGEKLYEELLMSEEGLQATPNKLIHIGKPIEMDLEKFKANLARLHEVMHDDGADVRSLVHEIVPTYNYTVAEKKADPAVPEKKEAAQPVGAETAAAV